MVKRKARAIRTNRQYVVATDSEDSSAEEFEEEVLPGDDSSEDDEEVIAAREKVLNYSRGWKSVALLQESDADENNVVNQNDATNKDVGVGVGVGDGEDSGFESGEDATVGETSEAEQTGDDSDGSCSEYYDSSDPGSYRDSTDEYLELKEDAKRKKSRYPTFKKGKGIPSFELGMLFNSNAEFKEAVSNYAIMTRHDIRFTKNEPNRCRAKCVGSSDCNWLIFGSFSKDVKGFQLKIFIDQHFCEPKRKMKLLTTKYLVSKFYDLVAAHPDIKIRYLRPFMERQMELDVNLTLCKRVRKSILSDLVGNCMKEYGKLRDYAEELIHSNPGTTVSLLTDRQDENQPPVFKAFYCCFKSCKEGILNGCRPVLGIDGCFLKGLVKEEMLTAIGRDGNNQMFPVAWAVVLVENTETWIWFLNLLRLDLGTAEREGWTLISDRQKGLVGAVADTWSKAEHRFCCRHLYANWCKTHSSRHLKNLFWSIAKSTNKSDFEEKFKELEKVHPAAAKDLMLVAPKYWCKAFFSTWSKCDSCDNNLCEAFNGTIVEARSKSIISMLEDIRRAIMKRFKDKRVGVNSWRHDYGPLIHKKVQHNVNESHVWVADWNGGGSYEVRSGRSQSVVRLRHVECTCGAWQLSGIPCPHAICAIHDNGEKPEDYINLWYKTNTYLRAYQKPLEPIRGENMWPKSMQDVVVPPQLRRMPGRPKKKRMREQHEVTLKNKLSRTGMLVTCRVCKGKGHNARSKNCPGVRATGVSSSQITDLTAATCVSSSQITDLTAATARNATELVQKTTTYVSPFQKDCRPKSKSRKRTLLTGLGLYINPDTGRSILNPGTSMARVVNRGSQNSKKKSSQHEGSSVGGS
ncbi:uncharacterized protein LOC119991542 [Tripterygium wilfordii]|uniref:uncharacterized protein LOC119991542 n=1 Tax=Tripterygium wilfordii TaxID=458696 RepID=UPI0018F83DB6|nr:uncharacterized protein LOC119991542 [Tripterygium wilfordii]